jgi:hypothetical protein
MVRPWDAQETRRFAEISRRCDGPPAKWSITQPERSFPYSVQVENDLEYHQGVTSGLVQGLPPLPKMIPFLPYSDDQLFDLCNLVLPAWILLAVAPQWR